MVLDSAQDSRAGGFGEEEQPGPPLTRTHVQATWDITGGDNGVLRRHRRETYN
jgi:hypothetical protein